MVRHVALFGIAGLSLALARDPGCDGVDSRPAKVNAPCTRDKDCDDDLVCREGVCASLDASAPVDAARPDSGTKDASGDGA